MTMPTDEAIWLTPAAHAGLVAELEQLSSSSAPPAPETEGRIRELTRILRRAEVGDKPDDGLVEPGMTVTVQFDGDDEPTTFLLAQRGIADSDPAIGMDVYPPSSPLGTAIAGLFPGDTFTYAAPSGATVSGRIVAASPFRGKG
ncbi:MAG: GreA/GreB family elongation factor [Actinomycetota bacterium]|nr:GreA/GreB family elongation factor [Actinomycetota bacterium]